MFKKVFSYFSSREEAAKTATPASAPPVANKGSLLDKLGGTEPAPAKKKEGRGASSPSLSPEELCGVTSSMNKDQVRAKLALLYRRHNRASSSLDAKLRAEAEKMLSAIVIVREKYFGPI